MLCQQEWATAGADVHEARVSKLLGLRHPLRAAGWLLKMSIVGCDCMLSSEPLKILGRCVIPTLSELVWSSCYLLLPLEGCSYTGKDPLFYIGALRFPRLNKRI